MSGTLQLGREINVSAGATAPVTGFPARCHTAGAPCGAPTLQGKVLPSTSAADSPTDTAVARQYQSGTAKCKAGFLERPERRRSFETRTNRTTLKPAPGYCRNRKCSFNFRGKGSVMKRETWNCAPGHNGKCSSSCVGFKLNREAVETTLLSPPTYRWSLLLCPNHELYLLLNIEGSATSSLLFSSRDSLNLTVLLLKLILL